MRSKVTVVEVGPRDGLQNIAEVVPTSVKQGLIERLVKAGLTTIEVTSFVSPKWVPQMADHSELMQALEQTSTVQYPALVPNLQGYEQARAAGCQHVAVFTAATDTFCKKNINCSVAESFERFAPIFQAAKKDGVPVRGYISCTLGCPYEGEVAPHAVATVAERLYQLGCYEISLGDTIGVGTPKRACAMVEAVAAKLPMSALAVHFHDTYGQALANVYAVLQLGIATVDAAVAGLGGCPYAGNASGNVATEDVVYLLNGLGIETGIDLTALIEAGDFICRQLNCSSRSKVAQAEARSV